MYLIHENFIKWASEYDDGDISMRSRAMHDEWQKQLSCPLIVLDGSDDICENFERVRDVLGNI